MVTNQVCLPQTTVAKEERQFQVVLRQSQVSLYRAMLAHQELHQ